MHGCNALPCLFSSIGKEFAVKKVLTGHLDHANPCECI